MESRRQFLKYLAASPALASVAARDPIVAALTTTPPPETQSTKKYAGIGDRLTAPDLAIDVFDFERLAEEKLPPAHWGYLKTGVDDDGTLQANRDGFKQFQLRPRRLVDVRKIDLSTEILGKRWPTPIVIAPTGFNKAFHPDGELAVARAAKTKNHLQVLSTVASTGVEQVNEARGEPVWYQLYPGYDWDITSALVDRAEKAGCPALVLTVDLQGGSNRVTLKRFSKKDERACEACHTEGQRTPMYDGLDLPKPTDYARGLTWDFLDQLRAQTSMKLLVKGIVTGEDAAIAVERGVDGLIVSNHGGRAEESLRSTIECLPEVVAAVRGRATVLVDSGFRRGGDIFKALALGADAVCIGRAYLWGLAAFGQAGVEAVLELLRAELEIVMRQTGVRSVKDISPQSISARR